STCANSSDGQTQLRFNIQPKKRLYTKESTRKDITDMVVLDELSFQFVEGRGFRKLIDGLLPDFSISADTIKRDIMKAYSKRKTLIKEILQNAEVTAHFLDKDWNLISMLSSFPLIPYLHTRINIANCIKAKTDEWFITTKLQTITLDNAASNNVAIHELADLISQDSYIQIDEELFHNRCLAHILNLIVKDSLKKIANVI
ncbi:8088_t:CDS:2, partial [Racocetra persica]